jgi:hypothetical protein
MLDEPILKGVKANDSDHAAGLENLRGSGQKGCELVQLTVDRYSQRLKRPRRRVDAANAGRTHGTHDSTSQVQCCTKLVPALRLFDAPRDAATSPFVAIPENQVRKLVVIEAFDKLDCGLASAAVHPHVERAFKPEAHAPLTLVELHGAESDIRDKPVRSVDAEESHVLLERPEASVDKLQPVSEAREACGRQV